MKRLLSSAMSVLIMAVALHAQTASDADELTKLLNEFLAGASRNDAAIHNRFWAEDAWQEMFDLASVDISGQRHLRTEEQ